MTFKNIKINFENICFVGNDINDFEVMSSVGLKLCPADAQREILEIADIVLKSKGGDGVIREIFSTIKYNE